MISRYFQNIIDKRKDCIYEIGKHSGSWIKYRVNRGQELDRGLPPVVVRTQCD